jgi:hypothetical protein
MYRYIAQANSQDLDDLVMDDMVYIIYQGRVLDSSIEAFDILGENISDNTSLPHTIID